MVSEKPDQWAPRHCELGRTASVSNRKVGGTVQRDGSILGFGVVHSREEHGHGNARQSAHLGASGHDSVYVRFYLGVTPALPPRDVRPSLELLGNEKLASV